MKSFQVLTPYLFVLSVKTRKSSKQQKKRYIHLYHLIKRNFKLLWKLTKIEKNTEAKSFDDLMILSVKKTSMLISISVYPTIISNRSPEQREKKQHIQSASCSIDETKAFFFGKYTDYLYRKQKATSLHQVVVNSAEYQVGCEFRIQIKGAKSSVHLRVLIQSQCNALKHINPNLFIRRNFPLAATESNLFRVFH